MNSSWACRLRSHSMMWRRRCRCRNSGAPHRHIQSGQMSRQMAITMYDLAGAEANRRFSPYCWRIKLSLKHKGLEFDTIPWRLTEKAAIAPYNSERVPVIIDNGRGIADSWAIANYLEDTY